MTAFTLELISLFLLFKGVLGYSFRENRVCIAAGIGVVLFHYAAFLWFTQEVLMALDYVWLVIPIAVVMLLFKGRPLTLLGIGISMGMIFKMFDSLCFGIWILAEKGRADSIDLVLNYNLSQGVCIAVLAILAYVLRGRRETIHSHVEKLNPLVFVIFVICSKVLLNNSWYFGRIDNDLAQMTYGENLIRNGILELFWLLLFIAAIILDVQRNEMKRLLILNEKCIDEQTEQYRLLSQGEQSLRQFRHDYNDHVAVLHDLAQHGDVYELRNYAVQMAEIKDGLRMIHTGNVIGDAIINRYDRICRAEGIELDVEGVFPESMALSETDLCVLLSNGIRNAYEATGKCEDKRMISIDIQNSEGYSYVVIKNPSSENLCAEENGLASSKEDKEIHGYGTRNMLETARKNDGDVSWEIDKQGVVTTTIMVKKSE